METLKKLIRPVYGPVLKYIREKKKQQRIDAEAAGVRQLIENTLSGQQRIFYLGITAHSNLGDMAQNYCIHNWIRKNYPDATLVEIEADTVIDKKNDLIGLLKQHITPDDRIIFQSGYTTQDLGGVHDLMHRLIIQAMPNAKILMMPQTIYFQHPENQKRSGDIYNMARNMLFLARDAVSFATAKEMMPDIRVELYPDIVTSLIGTFDFSEERKGVALCRRNDGEKFYSEAEIEKLKSELEQFTTVQLGDTTIKVPFKTLRENRRQYIEAQIKEYSKYEVIVTDRYHGTIFALAAGTPVVIMKTTDHKVVTGADWFKGVYDSHIYVARDLDDVKIKVKEILQHQRSHKLQPHMEPKYYHNLKSVFETGGNADCL